MRPLLLLLLCFTLYGVTYGQDRLVTVDSVTIPCRIQSATSQLVYFTDLNGNRQDFLPTLRLRELQYADSVRVLVIPASQRGQVRTLAFADFDKAWRQGAYATLLHAKTSRYDLTFLNGQVALTNEGRRQAMALVTLLKTRPAIHVRLTVHTDTLGQAASNKVLSDRRAAALQNFFAANGIDSRNLLVEGRGESEVISQSQALNRRLELQVVAIDGVKELYGETYIPSRDGITSTVVGVSPSERVSSGTPTAASQPVSNSPKPQQAKYSAPGASARYSPGFARIHLTIGPEFSYYPDPINKDRAWLNDSTGFGMKQNIGGSLRFDYQLLKPLAISITAGYFGWELLRRYTRNGIDEYTETKRLTQIPVQVGFKVYPAGGFYLMPEGGANFLTASVKTSELHPTPANESVTSTPITYGASLGYEIHTNAFLLDLSVRYQILNVNNLSYATFRQTLNERVNVTSFRLGIGFSGVKK